MEASWTKSADECLQYFDVQAEVTFYHKNCLNRPIMIFYDENSGFYAPKIAGFYDQSQLRRSDFDSNYFWPIKKPELGLNKEQIEEAEEKHGKNELPAEEGKSLWELIGSYHMWHVFVNLFEQKPIYWWF